MKAILSMLTVISLALCTAATVDAKNHDTTKPGDTQSTLSLKLIDTRAMRGGSDVRSLKTGDVRLSSCGSIVYLRMNTPAAKGKVLDIYSLSGHIVESHPLESGRKKFAIRCTRAQNGSYYAVLRDSEEKTARISPVSMDLVSRDN
ncbi:MAG: hypothetical protein ACOCW2_02555 [Chitinivibrionales bacterium]